jgi:hypothetical protein
MNMHKADLKREGYRDFEHWKEGENHVYVGRNMSFYVKGADGSKWGNPFRGKKWTAEQSLDLYEKYIRQTPQLRESLHELEGKVLGCWCHPKPCHAHVLVKLVEEYKKK